MSTGIYYQLQVAPITNSLVGLFVESGSSNTYCSITGRRARSWGLMYAGTPQDLIAFAIDKSQYFDHGVSVWKGMGRSGAITSKQWIRKIRRATHACQVDQPPNAGAVAATVGDRLLIRGKNVYEGKPLCLVVEAIQAFAHERPGDCMWQFFSVQGPKS